MNLAQYLNRFYQDLGEPNTARFPTDLVIEWLHEAEQRVNNDTRLIFSQDTQQLINDQQSYDLPTGILDWDIRYVECYTQDDSDDMYQLQQIDIGTLQRANKTWRNNTDTPKYWMVDPEEGKINLYPKPQNTSQALDGLRIVYVGDVTKMSHFYETGTVTMASSTAVTGADTVWTGNVSPSDEIGLGKLLDPAYETKFPLEWGQVLTVDNNTSITLASSWQGVTGSGLSYIVASPSSLRYSGLYAATLLYTMALAKRKDRDINTEQLYEQRAFQLARNEKVRVSNLEMSNVPMVPAGTLPSPGYKRKDYGY